MGAEPVLLYIQGLICNLTSLLLKNNREGFDVNSTPLSIIYVGSNLSVTAVWNRTKSRV